MSNVKMRPLSTPFTSLIDPVLKCRLREHRFIALCPKEFIISTIVIC
jgi:hypothetical protein